MSVNTLLVAEKAPYFLTLMVAGLAWTLLRTVDVLTESPTIAYSMAYGEPKDGMRSVSARICNISRTRQFRNLQFRFAIESQPPPGSSPFFTKASIVSEAPANLHEPSQDGNETMFNIPLMQPGWSFLLKAMEHSESEKVVLLQSQYIPLEKRDVGAQAPDVVRVVKNGFATWLVANELGVLILLMVIWLTGIAISVISIFNASEIHPESKS